MHPNGTPPVVPPPRDDFRSDDLFMELNDEGKAALADANWVNEHYSLGTFDEFKGQYIAVVDKKVLGHDKNLKRLRETVSRETGISVNRIVTTLIVRKQTA